MAGTVVGRREWDGGFDAEGYRNYMLKTLVVTTSFDDGPRTVFSSTGLPRVGSLWAFGNDVDLSCWCSWAASAKCLLQNEKCKYWEVTQNFTNKPVTKRCQDTSIENPLFEPMKISGSFTRYDKPTEKNIYGKYIRASSHEIVTGLKKPANKPTVIIEQNGLVLGLGTFAQMVNGLNDAPLWGVGARCVMLSNVSWSRQLYGTCSFYYTRRLEFEINYEGHDLKDVLDKGFKVLRGKWNLAGPDPTWQAAAGADPTKPSHFVLYKDYFGEGPPRQVALNGAGMPLTDPTAPMFIDSTGGGTPTYSASPTRGIQLSDEYNFFELGIPAFIGG